MFGERITFAGMNCVGSAHSRISETPLLLINRSPASRSLAVALFVVRVQSALVVDRDLFAGLNIPQRVELNVTVFVDVPGAARPVPPSL